MDILKMSKDDFKKVPEKKKWDEDIGKFDSLIIIPNDRIHDSGYMCMDFVAVKERKPICKISGFSDVIHVDGIGGYGKWTDKVPKTVNPKGWKIDCIPCGYLRILCKCEIVAGPTLSDFEIFGVR